MEVVLADGEILTLGGKNVKTSSGYSLIDLMVGSEGTLGILTKLTVKLIPEPKANVSLLIPLSIWRRAFRRCRRCWRVAASPRRWSLWSGKSLLSLIHI